MNNKIPYTRPSITDLEIKLGNDAIANGWGEKCYDYINQFEREFAKYLGVEYCIATSSCTGAMQLGLAALDYPEKSEVILADTNWIATAAPIVHQNLVPVFTDIKRDTWCIEPEMIEKAITKNTKAIIATHLYGNMCDMDKIEKIAKEYQIDVIEDAAEALGATYAGRKAGSIGRFGVFSFHGTKTMTTGEGGMLATNDIELYERALTLNNHGRARNETKQFWPSLLGFKYKISNVQAAIGCAQLQRINELVERKKQIYEIYAEKLHSAEIEINKPEKNSTSGYWMINAVFPNALSIDYVIESFRSANIDARVFFHPLSSLDMFENKKSENLVSYDLPKRSINLPCFHDITTAEIQRVCDVLLSIK